MIEWQVNDDDDDNEQIRTNIHAWRGIWNHGLSAQAIKVYTSGHAATGTSISLYEMYK
jgi:hypothetical protein